MKSSANKTIFLSLLFILLCAFNGEEEKTTIYLIGDSTMADKPLSGNPERGWGQMLPRYFNFNVVIKNYAQNGRSTKSYITEGRWQKVLDNLKPGNYVFIQFGHNDAKKEDSTRYAEPHTDYKNNLVKFIDEAKEKGANPVLITPVYRRKFDKNNNLVDQHGDYPGVVREVATEKNIPLIDLHKKSEKLLTELGVEGTKELYLGTRKPRNDSTPAIKEDNTHFTQYGAIKIAGLVVEGIKDLNLPFSKDLLSNPTVTQKTKIVALDYYFNNEWKDSVRFHYVWEDTTFSGFSELGKVLTNLNSEVISLTEAPVKESLKGVDLYIIVDPDTKKETENPHYIDEQSRKNIAEWVKDGGILVLMANDSANCEFDNLNLLSDQFGIHFNGDSKNRVTGTNFDMGKVNNFPDHPVFKGVKSIYLKEISTLTLHSPAVAILSDKGSDIMAIAEFGKGYVFAIGDPWLYNEYIDNRKLPSGFENFKAAKNLFGWLLEKSKNN